MLGILFVGQTLQCNLALLCPNIREAKPGKVHCLEIVSNFLCNYQHNNEGNHMNLFCY